MVDPLQASLKSRRRQWNIHDLGYKMEAFKFSWHIISTSPEKETWKTVCGNCQELYDDDEYHLIHGTHLCEACR